MCFELQRHLGKYFQTLPGADQSWLSMDELSLDSFTAFPPTLRKYIFLDQQHNDLMLDDYHPFRIQPLHGDFKDLLDDL